MNQLHNSQVYSRVVGYQYKAPDADDTGTSSHNNIKSYGLSLLCWQYSKLNSLVFHW